MAILSSRSRSEPGYDGRIISLAGVKGGQGAGLVFVSGTHSVTANQFDVILPANVMRKWCLILNYAAGDGEYIPMSLSSEETDGVPLRLYPKERLYISEAFPWTGSISCKGLAGMTGDSLMIIEASVQRGLA